MVSFTGSTRAGIEVAQNAAPTVKRVTQELGGKSANIILDDADLRRRQRRMVGCSMNSGQSCNAPTRMLVPQAKMKEAAAIAKAAADSQARRPARRAPPWPGRLRAQWDKIQGLIKKGIDEGATLVAGGLGLPEGLNHGYYVRPTVFADVTNDMTIAREEIFGPVLSILGYEAEEDAIDRQRHALRSRRLRVVGEPGARAPRRAAAPRRPRPHERRATAAPFGGYKQSGNGREWGHFGFEEFLETKAVMGWGV